MKQYRYNKIFHCRFLGIAVFYSFSKNQRCNSIDDLHYANSESAVQRGRLVRLPHTQVSSLRVSLPACVCSFYRTVSRKRENVWSRWLIHCIYGPPCNFRIAISRRRLFILTIDRLTNDWLLSSINILTNQVWRSCDCPLAHCSAFAE